MLKKYYLIIFVPWSLMPQIWDGTHPGLMGLVNTYFKKINFSITCNPSLHSSCRIKEDLELTRGVVKN